MLQIIKNNNSLINMFLKLGKTRQKLDKKNYCFFLKSQKKLFYL